MKKFIFMALSNPVPGLEHEFNEWYETVHLADVIAVPGIVAAQRYQLADTQVVGEGAAKSPVTGPEAATASPWKYLAIYEFETESALETFKDMMHRMETGIIGVPPLIHQESLTGYLYEPLSARRVAG